MDAIILLMWIIFTLILTLISFIATIAAIIWLIRDGLKNRSQGKCFFHSLNKRLVIIAGAYWYFECPKCGQRDAKQVKPGYSPHNQRWLCSGIWENPGNPTSTPPETIRIRRFIGKPITFKIYRDWPYQP